jgi:hypothetical protein
MLSFKEFLELKGKNFREIKRRELWKKELRIELNNYLLRPFPEIINASDEIANIDAIIEKVILRDLSYLFKVRKLVLEKLISMIAAESGMIITLE